MTSEINLDNYTTEDIKHAIKTVERYAAYRKEYYVANREKLIEKEKAYRKAHPEIERNKYNRKKDDPIFKEKRRIKNAKTYQRRKERLAAEKLAAQKPFLTDEQILGLEPIPGPKVI